MRYTYRCWIGHEFEVDMPLDADKPKEIPCAYEYSEVMMCSEPAKRVFGLGGFKI